MAASSALPSVKWAFRPFSLSSLIGQSVYWRGKMACCCEYFLSAELRIKKGKRKEKEKERKKERKKKKKKKKGGGGGGGGGGEKKSCWGGVG